MKDLNVTIVHSLPGRVRLRLARPPRSITKFIDRVKNHDGIEQISFNPVTLSVLVHYRPAVVTASEITVRVGIALSLDYGSRGVNIAYEERTGSLTTLDYYAVSALGAATASSLIAKETVLSTYLRYNAGYSTLLAVLRHAINDVQKEGIYDPEVISVVYLINAIARGNFLWASAITWFVTFGRHLLLPVREICRLEATKVIDETNATYIEVEVRPVRDHKYDRNPVRFMVVVMGKVMGMNMDNSNHSIMEQIRQMARKHGNVLEGIGKKPGPVYLRLTNEGEKV